MKLRVLAVVWITFSTMALSPAEPLFFSIQHSASKRFAILEETDGIAWLYLTVPGAPKPEKDALAYSTKTPDEKTDWSKVKEGHPPTLSKEFASERAVIRGAKEVDFTFDWADQGESVALRFKGEVIAMILRDDARGFSLALTKDGPLGHPLDLARAKHFDHEK